MENESENLDLFFLESMVAISHTPPAQIIYDDPDDEEKTSNVKDIHQMRGGVLKHTVAQIRKLTSKQFKFGVTDYRVTLSGVHGRSYQ